MKNRSNIYFHYKKDDELKRQLQPLFDVATNNDFKIVKRHQDASIIISVGGDGAFLQAVRKTGFRQDCIYAGITRSDES